MKLIVISNPVNLNNEHTLLHSLFENGLDYFHLRKPDFTSDEMEKYIQQIPAEYLRKTVIHSHHHLADKYPLKGKHKTSGTISEISMQQSITNNFISTSFHSTDELMAGDYNFEYVFLSPIFDSISKKTYKSTFNKNELKIFLNNYNKKNEIIALGGINQETIPQAIGLGFDGVAMLGAIWNDEQPLQKFKELKNNVILSAAKNLIKQDASLSSE